MRTQDEIGTELKANMKGYSPEVQNNMVQFEILCALLDIRDLLKEKNDRPEVRELLANPL